jgi:hypothetical protein
LLRLTIGEAGPTWPLKKAGEQAAKRRRANDIGDDRLNAAGGSGTRQTRRPMTILLTVL